MRKVTVWSLIGSLWTAFWLLVTVRITIPDYPWGTPIWKALYWDESGYFHELEAIALLWAVGMVALFVSSAWWAAISFLSDVRWVGVLPTGQPVFLRVKKRKGV